VNQQQLIQCFIIIPGECISVDSDTHNQIDYILTSTRRKSSITNAQTLPRADFGNDHQLLMTVLQLCVRIIKKVPSTVTRR